MSRNFSNELRTTFYYSASAAAGHRLPEAACQASLESETPSQSRTQRDTAAAGSGTLANAACI